MESFAKLLLPNLSREDAYDIIFEAIDALPNKRELEEDAKRRTTLPECSICLGHEEAVSFSNCGHCTCVICFSKFELCPQCRAPLDPEVSLEGSAELQVSLISTLYTHYW